MVSQVDVAIVGGGPAGISTALALRAYSDCRVAVIEQSDLSEVRVGEHVSAGILDLLAYLKVFPSDFNEDCFTPSFGTTSYWGSDFPVEREAIFSSEESSFQLNREDFDLTLIEKLVERNGHFIPRTKLLSACQGGQGDWELTLNHAHQGRHRLQARFVVDATGRRSKVSGLLGAESRKLDRLVGVGGLFQPPEGSLIEKRLTIETVEGGWWYLAKLRNDQLAAVYFSDADLVSVKQINRNENWLSSLSETKQVKRLLSGSKATRPAPWVRDASSRISDYSGVRNALAVGEAACAFDPISSTGIGFAISSGCHAARVIRACLEAPRDELRAIYQVDLEKHFSRYLTQRNQVYIQERRWEDSPFWMRRKGSFDGDLDDALMTSSFG